MKSLTSFILLIVKVYCAFKILQWIYLYTIDKTNHPIFEIQHILVFIIFDIWLITSANQLKDEIDNLKV